MNSDHFFGLALAYPFISPIIFALAHRVMESRQKYGWMKGLVVILIVNIILISLIYLYIYKLYSPVLLFLIPSLAIGLFLILPFGNVWVESHKNDQKSDRYKRISLLSASLLIAAYVFSPLISYGVVETCDDLHRNSAKPLIMAISVFENSRGTIPSEVGLLSPEFIKKTPIPTCLVPYSWLGSSNEITKAVYNIVKCDDGSHYLAVVSTSLGSVQAFNFSSSTWSKVYSFDPTCHSPLVIYPDD